MIRQKNGADTFYTLHTSRSSGGLLLTNEELRHVASRRREVRIPAKYGAKPLGVKNGIHRKDLVVLERVPDRHARFI